MPHSPHTCLGYWPHVQYSMFSSLWMEYETLSNLSWLFLCLPDKRDIFHLQIIEVLQSMLLFCILNTVPLWPKYMWIRCRSFQIHHIFIDHRSFSLQLSLLLGVLQYMNEVFYLLICPQFWQVFNRFLGWSA